MYTHIHTHANTHTHTHIRTYIHSICVLMGFKIPKTITTNHEHMHTDALCTYLPKFIFKQPHPRYCVVLIDSAYHYHDCC